MAKEPIYLSGISGTESSELTLLPFWAVNCLPTFTWLNKVLWHFFMLLRTGSNIFLINMTQNSRRTLWKLEPVIMHFLLSFQTSVNK